MEHKHQRLVINPNTKETVKALHTVLLHDRKEFDDDLGAWSNHDLALAGSFGVVDGIERIVEDGSANHFVRGMRFSMAVCD